MRSVDSSEAVLSSPHSPVPTCQLTHTAALVAVIRSSMDRENLQLEVDSLRSQASMERWPVSRSISG